MKAALDTDYRSILKLALPVSAGTFMQFLVVLTDNFFLSRTSDVALNGAGNAGVMYITLGMIGAGFCNTGQILIARRVGEGQSDAALRILRTGLGVTALVGLLLIAAMSGIVAAGFTGVGATPPPSSRTMGIRKWGFLPLSCS